MDIRSLITLVEGYDRLDYMQGECHVFALAAQEITGWDMVATLKKGRKRGESSYKGFHDIVHVYLLTPDGERFDALGIGGSAEEYEYEKEMQLGGRLATIPFSKAEIDQLVKLGWLSTYSTSELQDAALMVRENLEEEGLGEGTQS